MRINYKFINRLLRAYGVTSRKPNRKFKVSRETLSQRAKLYWLSTARVRKLIQLAHGYDPVFTNVDQSHFHMNETGSCADNTLVEEGCPTVPLHQKHTATRQRCSLNSVTHSDEDEIRRELPGFEMMFKKEEEAEENVVQDLNAFVVNQNLDFRVSVVTGTSESYKEEDILEFLEKWLKKWPHGDNRRRWEIFVLDAYAPGLTRNCQHKCWERGYVLIWHGGGSSMVTQTNDTDLHQEVRKRFVAAQEVLQVRKMQKEEGGVAEESREDNLKIMIDVMRDPELHIKAAKGYKRTGTTVSLDGQEDHLIVRDAKAFWDENDMRNKITSAVADVERRWNDGTLKWNFQDVMSLIHP